VADALGRNARQAVLDIYSWRQHVTNVWSFAIDRRQPALAAPRRAPGRGRPDPGPLRAHDGREPLSS
jgi:hypothetical protein